MTTSSSFARPADEGSRRITMTPEIAAQWLVEFRFPRQRPIRRAHVENLMLALRSGSFARTSIGLASCAAENQRSYLVDGYHRLEAVRDSGCPVELTLEEYTCSTFEDVATLYGHLDRGMVRSANDVLWAHGLADELGLPKRVTEDASGALILVAAGFRDYERKKYTRNADARVELVRQWHTEISAYQECIRDAGVTLSRRLRRAAIQSVGLVTLRYAEEDAWVFWQLVASGDAIRKGTPEHTLREWIADNVNGGTGTNRASRAVAAAWNGYVARRPLKLIKVFDPNAPIVLAGTPFKGER